MKKLILTMAFAIMTVFVGFSQNPTPSAYTYTVDNVGHITGDVHGEVLNPTADSIFFFTEVAPVGSNNFTTVTDTGYALETGFITVNQAMSGLSSAANLKARIRCYLRDTAGVVTMDNTNNAITFTTLSAPHIGLIPAFTQAEQGVDHIVCFLAYSCGNIPTDYIIEWGTTFGNYNLGPITLTLQNSGDTLIPITGLPSGSNIYVRVYSHNALGYGQPVQVTFQTAAVVGLNMFANVSATVPTQATGTATFNPGTYSGGIISAVLKNANWGIQENFNGVTYANAAQHSFSATNLVSSASYHWIFIYSDMSGSVEVRDTVDLVSLVWEEMTLDVNVTTPAPDSSMCVVTFDPGTFGAGILSASLRTGTWGLQQNFPGISYSGIGSRTMLAGNLTPGELYYWIVTYTQVSGTMGDQDTLAFLAAPVNAPTGNFQNVQATQSEAIVNVMINPNGNFPGSATMLSYLLTNVNTNMVDAQGTLNGIITTGLQTLTLTNLIGGSTYTLSGTLTNEGGITTLASIPVIMSGSTHNSLVVTNMSESTGNFVTVTVNSNGHGNRPLLKLGLRVNSVQMPTFDTLLTSGQVTFTKVFGPYNNCDQIQVEALAYTDEFGDVVADGNLQSITINCPESVEEIWNGLIVTPEFIELPVNIHKANLEIFTTSGQLLATQTLTGRTEFSLLNNGIYLLRLTTDDEQVITRKIMK